MLPRSILVFLLGFIALIASMAVLADVVKPALIEIEVHRGGEVHVEIRASIEAILSGINSQYGNTQDSPFAEAYDELRALPADDLLGHFRNFEAEFLDAIWLEVGNSRLEPRVLSVSIPEAGYTKVPRISTLEIGAELPMIAPALQWYYPARFSDSAVRVKQVDLETERWHWSAWQWIRSDQPTQPFSLTEIVARPSTLVTVWTYLKLGFLHIVPRGSDHVLFILGLYLFSTRFRPLFWQVTLFTLAHTLTLGLSASGVIELPARIVEPLIALSIAYIGIENIFRRRLAIHRLVIVFAFGLLHGLGFANVLNEFGMPEDEFFPALVGFNVGVEFGQLTVILAAYLAIGLWFAHKNWYRKVIVIPGSVIISLVGLAWFIARLA